VKFEDRRVTAFTFLGVILIGLAHFFAVKPQKNRALRGCAIAPALRARFQRPLQSLVPQGLSALRATKHPAQFLLWQKLPCKHGNCVI
jgi:hypothetical protein